MHCPPFQKPRITPSGYETPQDEESERVIIGALMNSAIDCAEVESAGSHDLFFTPQLQHIYRVIHRMAVDKIEINADEVRMKVCETIKPGTDEMADYTILLLDCSAKWTDAFQNVKSRLAKLIKVDKERNIIKMIDVFRSFQREGNIDACRRIVDEISFILNYDSADDLAGLDARKIDPMSPPTEPIPIFTLSGRIIATSGNIVSLLAQAKAGKTACISAMITAATTPSHPDTFGFECDRDRKGAIIHIDTEQSRYDAWRMIDRATRRAGLSTPPPWLRSYALADVSPDKRRYWLTKEIERAADTHGGIHSIFIDGAADLAFNVNDITEAASLVSEFHALAIKYKTVIVCAIHENPSAVATSKARGHLGSELERKAEANISLCIKDGITEIYMDKGRNGSIPKGTGPKFAWSDEHKMHMSHEGKQGNTRKESRLFDLRETFGELLADGKMATYTELKGMLQQAWSLGGKKASADLAKVRITEAKEEGIITKDFVTEKWKLKSALG